MCTVAFYGIMIFIDVLEEMTAAVYSRMCVWFDEVTWSS